MKDFIYTITIFSSTLFFAAIAILGISYTGSADSNLYKYSSFILALICCIILIYDFLVSSKATKRFYISLIILTSFSIIGLATGYSNSTMYRQFIVFCLPASLVGIHYARLGSIAPMVKWLDLVMLLLSSSFIFTVQQLISGIQRQEVYYSQMMSYCAAFSALLNLFLIQYGTRYNRFAFFKTKLYKVICYILLPYQVLTIFIGGGRGAVVTFCIGLFVYILQYKKRKLVKNIIIIVTLVIGGTYFIFSFSDSNLIDTFIKNTARSFSFADKSLSLYDRTSGRNYVYEQSLKAISNQPISGYGLFSFVEQIRPNPYPHNIFMEWALQWGVIYSVIFTIIVLNQIKKINKLHKQNPTLILIYPLLVWPFSELLYSGSYMQTSLFWFIIMFIYNYKKVQEPLNIRNNHYSL